MTHNPRLTIVVGPARAHKTKTILTMIAEVRPLAIVVTDRTPAQFRGEYGKFYALGNSSADRVSPRKFSAVRVLADTEIRSTPSPFAKVQGIFVTDSPLSPLGSVQSDIQLLTLARMAIRSSADVFAEWSIFHSGPIEVEVGNLALKFKSPLVTKLEGLNIYVVSGEAQEIIAAIGNIFSHFAHAENVNQINPLFWEHHS